MMKPGRDLDYAALREQDRYAVARLIGRLNQARPASPQTVMLLGPGRWGTASPELGIPVNFTETAPRRLLSIAASGARCGVYTLIHWDQRLPLPAEFIPEELRKSSVCLTGKSGAFTLRRTSSCISAIFCPFITLLSTG